MTSSWIANQIESNASIVAVAKGQNSHLPLLIVILVVVQAVDAFSFLIAHALVHFLGRGSCYCHSIVNAFHSLHVVSGWIDTVNHKFHQPRNKNPVDHQTTVRMPIEWQETRVLGKQGRLKLIFFSTESFQPS